MGNWTAETREKVAVLTFRRLPDNQMDLASLDELAVLLEDIAQRTGEVSVVLLKGGVDGIFVKHADLDILRRAAAGTLSAEDAGTWPRTLGLLESLPQPVVAAIDGQAWGGGLETALAATLRIASVRSHFSQPEIRNGLIPGGGGTQRLPRLIGSGRGAELILTGRTIGAEEALRLGILNAVLPTEDFDRRAEEWVAQVARNPAPALFAAKRAVLDGLALPLAEGLALEATLFGQVIPLSAFG
ncbi:enoyl-CoA hydratase/isomerase family protein [Streptomyces sp. NBC_01264]|uniref:enoyl-CoA hydratase/isomerase family protein n=1 Tax=Streptomyces sp. NBC_01264 TaxID=2903804 RepID=UPI0022559BB9|nr:enoyl-CoA hydratase/isomerase family protein [Streptomyces sp. NBC_01264]MCX4781697.1 enoyl-CoA hydratase/isomerase family protein [Streptomyces sp. NBC_01264]